MFAKRPEKTITDNGNRKIYTENPLVITNYLRLKAPSIINCYQYDISYYNEKNVKVIDKDVTRKIFWGICNSKEYGFLFPMHTKMLFNDSNLLFSLDLIKFEGTALIIEHKIKKETYQMRMVFVGFIEVDRKALDTDTSLLITEFINSAITQRLRAKSPQSDGRYFLCYGQSVFYHPLVNRIPGFSVNIGQGLQALAGLYGSVKLNCQGGLFYNVDVTHAVLNRQHVNALELAIELMISGKFDTSRGPDFWRRKLQARCYNSKSGFNDSVVSKLNKFFKGLSFLRCYDQKKELEFHSIRKIAASCDMFDYETSEISVADYFNKVLKKRVQFPFLPCLKVGHGKGKLIPIEFLMTTVTPVPYYGLVSDSVAETLLKETAWGPEKRFRAIQEMSREGGEGVTFKDDEHIGVWQLAQVTAGDSEVKYKKSVESMKVKIVVAMIIVDEINAPKEKANVNDMPYKVLMRTLYNFGVDVHLDCRSKPVLFERFVVEQNSLDALGDRVDKFKNNAEVDYPGCIPLCIFQLPRKFPTKRVKRNDKNILVNEYGMIKYVCDVKVGINSQCILKSVYDEITDKLECSIARRISLKIMAKLGIKHFDVEREGDHVNWTRLTDPAEPTLLIGIDVTHLDAEEKKPGYSHHFLDVIGIVGNTDAACLRYDTSVCVQRESKERTVSMKDEIKRRIVAFEEANNIRPVHIVVYRDAVSDGCFQRTLHVEKAQIKQACAEIDQHYKPTLTYIALTKRHHTRFALPKDQNDPTNISGVTNVKAGTLVENVITSNSLFDFFLVSHNVDVGTSRPVHYHVLYDEWQPSFAFWQTISHALAHAFVRVPKTVSLPAPVMYAHLAARRAKHYMEAYANDMELDLKKIKDPEQLKKMNESLQRNKNLKGMIFL